MWPDKVKVAHHFSITIIIYAVSDTGGMEIIMEKPNFMKIVTCLSLIMLLLFSQFVLNVYAESVTYNEKTAADTVLDMGIGWNLGNTLEACGDWINGQSVTDYETAWGNIVTTQAVIDGIKAAGFKTVRIPVAWSNLMSADYTINREPLKRVKEVVDYCSNNGMYAVVNIHWDGGWFEKFATDYDEAMRKYTSIWTQISNYFKDYPNNLILESLNEEGCWNSIWNRYGGTSGEAKTRAYNILNSINQKFVDIVRASGGNNTSRCLLIAGYATDIDLTCDDCFKMPADTINNKLIISVHYYTPSTFTILEEDADWGECATTWGTEAEINLVKTDFNKMKNRFASNGIPVIVGEYGTTIKNKDPESVRLYISTVCKTAYDLGFCPILWDSSTHYSRSDAKIKDPQLAEMFLKYKESTRVMPGDVNDDKSVDDLDYIQLKNYLLNPDNSINEKNADINQDGGIDALDLAQLKKSIA